MESPKISITELRVGNFINTPNPHMNPFKVESIWGDKVGGNNGFDQYVYWAERHISPIILTEDWLAKFGFKVNHTVFDGYEVTSYAKDDFIFGFSSFGHVDFDYKGIGIKTLEYVHKIQNLYQAITGYDLIISK